MSFLHSGSPIRKIEETSGASNGLCLNNFVADGVADKLADGAEIEFAHEVGAMSLGGLDADAEMLGHFLGAPTFGDELKNLMFARSKFLDVAPVVGAGAFRKNGGDDGSLQPGPALLGDAAGDEGAGGFEDAFILVVYECNDWNLWGNFAYVLEVLFGVYPG